MLVISICQTYVGQLSLESPLFSVSLCDFVFEMNLAQLVTESTHVKGNILDLVFTNVENSIHDFSISNSHPLIPSDHRTISFKINCIYSPRQRTSHKPFFDYSKADLGALCDHLLDTDFSDCLYSDNVEYVWSSIKSSILNAMNIYIPKVRIKPRKHPKWYNSDIRHMLNCICTVRRKYNKHPTSYNLSKLHNLDYRAN